MNNIWKWEYVGLTTKCRLVTAIIPPLVTYDCKTWTLKKADRGRVDAFELCCWRQLLHVPQTAKIPKKS